MGLNPAAVNRMLHGARAIKVDEVPVIEEYLGQNWIPQDRERKSIRRPAIYTGQIIMVISPRPDALNADYPCRMPMLSLSMALPNPRLMTLHWTGPNPLIGFRAIHHRRGWMGPTLFTFTVMICSPAIFRGSLSTCTRPDRRNATVTVWSSFRTAGQLSAHLYGAMEKTLFCVSTTFPMKKPLPVMPWPPCLLLSAAVRR